jgi:tRNA U34 5-methylaminomethyl-2-thiouridine-forming methyltransferase MnmC
LDLKIKITADDSPTVYSSQFNVTYHSEHGALQESEHVFIRNGFEIAKQKFSFLNVLEIGFGTGLNALLTLQDPHPVYYHAIEKFPLQEVIYKELDYGFDKDHLEKLHKAEWEKDIKIKQSFTLHKSANAIETITLKNNYHLIYFDTFAPPVQEELWQEEMIRKMYDCLLPGGMLVTFCAKGNFKRLLRSAGFTVESPKGAARKREMTRP